ncbi:MAG: UDP-N-acetylmuramoyl-L-alanine--D-glutamate ligase, partial [Candidatus Methylomirabilis sp.]
MAVAMLDLTGRRVVVVGLARSGGAACRLLLKQGASVIGTDQRGERELGADLDGLQREGVILELGGHRAETLLSADLVVVSPGVDLREPLFQQVRGAGIPLIGEVELAYRYSDATFLGVTGTNGKSTTTALLGAMLKASGLPSLVAGNIGVPLCQVAPGLSTDDIVVAELSSFQLEAIERFRPRVGLLLNLAPDHLDRYNRVEDYYRAKARLFENQEPSDFAVVNADDPLVREAARQARARTVTFSRGQCLSEGAFLDDDRLTLALSGRRETICRWDELRILGVHILVNAVAASLAEAFLGAPAVAIREALVG